METFTNNKLSKALQSLKKKIQHDLDNGYVEQVAGEDSFYLTEKGCNHYKLPIHLMAKKKTTNNPTKGKSFKTMIAEEITRQKPIVNKTRIFDQDFTKELLFELRELLDQARERNAILAQRTLKHSIIVVEDYQKRISI